MMEDIAEFYITCNPPLLPQGVKEVIKEAHQVLQEDIFEILYEPDTAWLKCITPHDKQTQATIIIQGLLLSIVNEEVEPLDCGDDGEFDGGIDVNIDAPHPRVTPWATYQALHFDYEELCYPHGVSGFEHKATWRGLERSSIITVKQLLADASRLWNNTTTPLDLDSFASMFGCQMSHNIGNTVIYIGAETVEAVHQTVRKLDNIWEALQTLAHPVHKSHIVAVEGNFKIRLAYRYLSHIKLDIRTLIPPHGQNLREEYNVLLNHAAALRTKTADQKDNWELDSTHYPLPSAPTVDLTQPFGVFATYSFKTKDYASAPKPAISESTATLNEDQWIYKTRCKVVGGSLKAQAQKEAAPTPARPRKESDLSTERQKLESELGVEKTTVDKAGNVMEPSSKAPTAMPRTNSSIYKVDEWMDSLAIVSEDPFEQDLMSFEGPSEGRSVSPGLTNDTDLLSGFISPLRYARPTEVRIVGSSDERDLICFDSRPASPTKQNSELDLLSCLYPQNANIPSLIPLRPSNAGRDKAAPWLSIAHHGISLLDDDQTYPAIQALKSDDVMTREDIGGSNSLPLIDFDDSPPKELHGTMNQKASCRGSETHASADTEASESQKRVETIPEKSVEVPASRSAPKGMDSNAGVPYHGPREPLTESSLLEQTKAEAQNLATLLRWAPGDVKFELKFGRTYFQNLPDTNIYRGRGPDWDLDEYTNALNEGSISNELIRFQTILTSAGADADSICHLDPYSKSIWDIENVKRVSTYDFVCRLNGEAEAFDFVVEVDAETFAYSCRGLAEEIGTVSIHYPQRAWDLRLCAERTRCAGMPAECHTFAGALVASLDVQVDKAGELHLKTLDDVKLAVKIDYATIRQVARYCSTSGSSSILSITMTRPIKRVHLTNDGQRFAFTGRSDFGAVGRLVKRGGPFQWFEASISSSAAELLLESNQSMGFGEQSKWDGDTLEAHNVFDDICRPGLDMILQMDHIGSANDNNRMPTTKKQGLRRTIDPRSYEFW